MRLSVLDETNISGLFSERLSANVETVLANDGIAGSSDTAKNRLLDTLY